jgi:BirA family biotin operon repressor/biotin-[acetyl-CoA-carboxylase] ligase
LILDEIKTKLRGIIGREIHFFETVSSTNTIALERAEKAPEGTVVIADSQDKGRGRLGRIWISPPGVNIYMSIILRPQLTPKDGSLITIMSAVACATALRSITGLEITTKWPNDLMINNKKMGGILTELKTQQHKITSAIVGIGINVNAEVSDFPEEMKQTATSLKNETAVFYSREPIVAEILNEMDRWYKTMITLEKETIVQAWKSLTSTLGRQVVVVTPHETLKGSAESIDNEGMLLLRLPSGQLKRINSGDLKILQ